MSLSQQRADRGRRVERHGDERCLLEKAEDAWVHPLNAYSRVCCVWRGERCGTNVVGVSLIVGVSLVWCCCGLSSPAQRAGRGACVKTEKGFSDDARPKGLIRVSIQ